MVIYIDHYPDADKLAKELARRIRKENKNVEVVTFFSQRQEDPDADEDTQTLELIDRATIIIPLISSLYLSDITDVISTKFETLSEAKDKFILPIISTETSWASQKWIVKSKVLPESGISLDKLSEDSKEKVLANLLQTIKNIIYNEQTPQKVVTEKATIYTNKSVVFISHSHDDSDFAELLKLYLEKHKISVWVDTEKLKIGQDWREEIDEGINNCLSVIAIMSPEAKLSEYVTYEWAYAWGRNKKIFPIMLKQTTLHPRLESLQYLDFTNRSTRPWDVLISSIKELIK